MKSSSRGHPENRLSGPTIEPIVYAKIHRKVIKMCIEPF